MTKAQRSFFISLIITTYYILHTTFLTAQPASTVRLAIEAQLKQYPASTLQDIYKSFFQDEFGPGHLAPDSAGAAGYLEYELAGMTSKRNYIAEPCGTGNNFYRVPLDLVQDSIIPKEEYLEAFLESAKDFKIPDIEEWKAKWEMILTEIERMNVELPNFEADKKTIAEMLDRGEAVVHHSEGYIKNYDPHYRIISKAEMEKLNSKFKIQNSKF